MIDATPNSLRNSSGVYLIINVVTSKVYVGSTKHFNNRFRAYKSSLKSGSTSQKKLLNSYLKHGGDCFIYVPISLVPVRALKFVEQFYIDQFDSVFSGYNTVREAMGRRTTDFNLEHRAKLSASNRRRKGKYRFSDEARQNISRSVSGTRNPRCKLSASDIELIRSLLGKVPGREIAKMFSVSTSTISHIKTGRLWA